MKKFVLSFSVIALSITYAAYQNTWGAQYTATALTDTQNSKPNIIALAPTFPKTTPVVTAPSPVSPPKQTKPVPKPTPVVIPAPVPVKPKGQYTDGTYTGAGADAYYGTVQVQVAVSNGKIASVDFLQYPNDRGNSIRINNRAMPILQTEAIQAQNANVHIVSGATDTSMAFQQSLGDALSQAKA